MLFNNILFPVDFSKQSEAAVPHVEEACKRFNAGLTLLHVVHAPPMAYGAADAPVVFEFPMDEMKASARQKLENFGAAAFPGRSIKTLVEEGDPGLWIAEIARNQNIDLIMMPTRGHGGFRAALLGSVTAKTLHDATCATWTEAHCDKAGAQHAKWKNILCAIDNSDESPRLIGAAQAITITSGARVCLAHAVPAPTAGVEQYYGSDFTAFLKETARKDIDAMQKEAGTTFGVCIEAGPVTEVLHHAAVHHKADLVMIGRGVLQAFAGGLRSHTYAIVRDMPCPVLRV